MTAGAATLLGALVWTAFKAAVHQPPWSTDVAVVGDMGEQSIPFLAYYRDVLTGRANGDLLYAWGMTYGQSFWGTFAQYLSNPFNLLVLLFPRTHVPQALFAVQIAMGAATAGAMSLLLSALRPGWRSLNVVLAVAWATIPFLSLDASYHPYWGVGVLVLPLMVLSALWVRDGRRGFAVILLFGLAFWANFYTAYMATLGAGLLVIGLMVSAPGDWPRPVRTLAAWAARAGLGVALVAVLIVPTYFAVQQSAQPPEPAFDAGRLVHWLAAALPGADTVLRAPSWSPGLPALVLVVIALGVAPPRARGAWGGLLAVVLLSMAWRPTSLLWHGGDVPNGNFFRQAWVVAGIGLVAVWQLAPVIAERARRPRGWVWPAGVGLAGMALAGAVGMASLAGRATVVSPRDALLGGLLAAGAAAVVALRGLPRGWGQAALLGLVVVAVALGHVRAVDRFVARVSVVIDFSWLPAEAAAIDRALAAGHGISAGLAVTEARTMNDPLLLGGAGLSGYSTMMPSRSGRVALLAGATTRSSGRRAFTRGTPIEHAVFGVVDSTGAERPQARWLDRTESADVPPPETPLEFYAAHLGDDVQPAALDGGTAGTAWRGTVACPDPAGVLYADGSRSEGRLTVDGVASELPPRDAWRGRLNQVAASEGPWSVIVAGAAAADPASVLLCAASTPRAMGEGATIRRSGHGFSVEPSRLPREDLLVATPYSPEWQCTAESSEAPVYDRAGLLAVRAAGRSVSCTFVPRGLLAGAAISGGALVLCAGLAARAGLRRRWQVPHSETPAGLRPGSAVGAQRRGRGSGR